MALQSPSLLKHLKVGAGTISFSIINIKKGRGRYMDNMTEKNLEMRIEVENVEERLHDIKNVVQLLEISLTQNKDDDSVIRSVGLIRRMINTLISNDMLMLKDMIYNSDV